LERSLIAWQGIRFIGYDDCTLTELRKFARDRGLTTPSAEKPSKSTLIQRLLEADETPTFTRFFELSAELRQTIYEYYVGDFGTFWYHYLKYTRSNALSHPVTPPLAQVSRRLRDEALPVFYNSCRFRLYFTPDQKCDSWRLSDRSREWLNRLSTEHLGCIRRLEIQTVAGNNIFNINLNHGEIPVQRHNTFGDISPRGILDDCERIVAQIRGREKMRLTMDDILELEKAIARWTKRTWCFENPARAGDL
jgi:hypothetical protein